MVVLYFYKKRDLGKPMRSLIDEIRRFRSKVPEDLQVDLESLAEVAGLFEECHVLGECWQQYLKATASLSVRHLPPVTPYFSSQYLIEERGLRRDNETMPGAFTGYGILGTFVGLVLGLGQMNVADAVAIRGSINVLISGMSMAFLTSIVGVFLSLSWTAADQRLLRSTTRELEGLHDTLNRLVPSPSGMGPSPGSCISSERTTCYVQRLCDRHTNTRDAIWPQGSAEGDSLSSARANDRFV
ncbi:MAG: MotA/TolQ/ExbB proton channel family protein [Bacillota bacterium]